MGDMYDNHTLYLTIIQYTYIQPTRIYRSKIQRLKFRCGYSYITMTTIHNSTNFVN